MTGRWPIGRQALPALAAVLLVIYVALAASGFGPHLTDLHGFRQTQTAISARYFSGWSDWLAYQTPVFGPPWSVPFEFPLYQALAQGLHRAIGLTLESSGRLVAIGFFLACFWPLHQLLRAWAVEQTLPTLAMVLLTPFYVFWSRAFMIETAALFFMLAYLAAFVRFALHGQGAGWALLWMACSGCLAALVKITTVLPIMLLTGALTARLGWQAWQRRAPLARPMALMLVQVGVLALASAWVAHTDALRSHNPLSQLLSSHALREWNFGTLAQRADPAVWWALADRSVNLLFPLPSRLGGLRSAQAVVWLLMFVWLVHQCTPARRRQVAVLLGLFVLPFLIFTNLHWVHDYYQAANALFLSLAVGLAAHGAMEAATQVRRARQVLALYLVALLLSSLNAAAGLYFNSSYRGRLQVASAWVTQHSAADTVLVITGLDYSAVLPYQANRRALMLPDAMNAQRLTAATVDASLVALQRAGVSVSLYLACGGQPSAVDGWVRERLGLAGHAPSVRADGCDIYSLQP